MKKVIILLVTALLLSGCMTPKKIDRFRAIYCQQFADTIIKDRPIKIPIYYNDTALLELYLECDSLGNVYQREKNTLNGKITTLQSELQNNKVTVYSRVKVHDTVYIHVNDTIVKSGVKVEVEKPITGFKKFKLNTWWYSVLFNIFVLLFAAYFIYRKINFFKKYLP